MGVLAELVGPGQRDQDHDSGKKEADLRVFQQRPGIAAHRLQVENERHGAHQHERGSDHVDGCAAEVPHGSVIVGEPAGRDRRHRMHDRVEHGHAGDLVSDGAHAGQGYVQHRDRAGDLGRPGQNLVGGIRGFHSEQLHAADLQHRQNGDGHDDDADAAEPLQQSTP